MEFAQYFDHTILKPEATAAQVKLLCDEAKKYGFASVCVNSCYTSLVAGELAGTNVKTCTVIGFPLGAMSTYAKALEAVDAIEQGTDEVDMVINVGLLKAGELDDVRRDIAEVVNVCKKNSRMEEVTLKVIIETCLLTDDEKVIACRMAMEAGADFVKTSTGFSTGGATVEDVALMKKTVGDSMKVKASGGIRDYKTAQKMIEAGADRIGASATVAIMREYEQDHSCL